MAARNGALRLRVGPDYRMEVDMRILWITPLVASLAAGTVAAQSTSAPSSGIASGTTSLPNMNAPAKKGGANDRNPIGTGVAECIKLWDSQTPVSKQDWARSCERNQAGLKSPSR